MDSIMLSAETYKAALPDCLPGENVTVTITTEKGKSASFTGQIAASGEDGGVEIPLSMGASEGEAEEEMETESPSPAAKRKMSRGAAAVLGEEY